jgi:AcrR family transcriptional regulator
MQDSATSETTNALKLETLQAPPARAKAVASGMTRRDEKSLETRTRILDSAEELFSKRGADGVTLRDIAQLAEVDTALLHYYFDSKHGTFEAVLARRAAILHYEITESLAKYECLSAGRVSVDGTIGAYLRPIFRLGRTGGHEWRNYCALVFQLGNPGGWASDTIATYFDPIAAKLLGLLRKALPSAADDDLNWSYQLMARALTLTFTIDQSVERLSGGVCRAGDLDALEARMVLFAAAGFVAVCAKEPSGDLGS